MTPSSQTLLMQLRGGLSLQVQAMSGKMITVEDIDPQSTVMQLKERLQQREGLSPDQQRLIVNGRHMKDTDTLASYNISDKTVVHLVLRLRGGLGRLHREADPSVAENQMFSNAASFAAVSKGHL
ncbi:hypothetical protein cyc_08064 [Cyclospora cayetanensis]|uniref:Ubiquitin-like domain-containing protein n=1 Tax=Cyclospora cayetanensis TaxID=88456 RepID=A0A1D3D415_9EIME|nr:hypothetical protein cyc_08064 [Cyclospora cayetanensis]